MKKIISLFLAVFMMLTLCMGTFAAEPTVDESIGTITDTRGSITINNLTLEDGAPTGTLEIYQILKLESYDFTSGAYRYLLPVEGDPWYGFFIDGEGADYITVDTNGLVVWNGDKSPLRTEKFAQIALAYADEHSIEPVKTTATAEGEAKQYTVTGDSTIKFTDLELGYYLVDSSVGALCGLSTTNPNGIINSKNGAPTIDKQVQEDLTGQYGDVNSADIGQEVNFRTTIHVHDGAQSYVLHDIMEEGLTFSADHAAALHVKLVKGDGSTGTDGETVERTHTVDGKTHTDYSVVTDCQDGCAFEVHFSDEFCAQLDTNDRLIIFYSAMLNRNAEIGNGTADNPANENKTYLEYGDHHHTTEDSTVTKTYGIDLVKTDGQNKLLDGATFKIYDSEKDGTEVKVVPLTDSETDKDILTEDGYKMYRRARADEAGVEIEVTGGKVRIVGFDNGTYWLEEIKNPKGYSKIEGRQKFTISDNNLDAVITNDIVSTNSGVQVVNYTGTMLPETGAAGKTMFITFGAIVVLATGVLLVTKKRMSMIQ